MSMTPLKKGITLKELDAIGPITGLGGELLDDKPVEAFIRMTHGGPTDAISAGYFGTTGGHYRLVYPFSEQATVLSGVVRITDESTGVTTEYRAGDSWFVQQGTSTRWEVDEEGYTKHYLAFVQG